MDWREALEVVIARTGHQRYRELCGGDHPEHEGYRRVVVEKARQFAGYPPLARQAASLAGAVGRVVIAAARGEPIRVPADVLASRRATCAGCEHHDHATDRCRMCGCSGLKLELATETCPIGLWERRGDTNDPNRSPEPEVS